MSRSRFTQRAAFTAVSLSVAAVAVAAPAVAASHPGDASFTPNAASSTTPDLVGVGSDTSEMALHFLAEGSGSTPGFNAGKSEGRIASFAAKDASTPTITLREGSAPVGRPNGSTPGKATLFGNSANPDVSFARSSSALSTAEKEAGLQAYPFAVDGLKLAVRSAGTNAPATISDADLVGIYKGDIKNWSEIGGQPGVIEPLIPQAGSGTRSFFEAQLQARNGGTKVTLGGNVTETQEHSDAGLVNNPNAVAPFSTGRAKGTPTVKLTGGFVAQRALYNVLRGTDVSKPAFQAVFGKSGFICSPAAEPLIAAAGFEQLAAQSKRGVCGVATQGATSNFKTSADAEGTEASATSLTAQGAPNGTVRLSAEIDPGNAGGTVKFFEGETQVGPTAGVTVADGEAVATLEGVTKGTHTYRAEFASADIAAFSDSTSADATATVSDRYDGVIAVDNPASVWGVSKKIDVTIKSGGNAATGAVKLVYGDSPEVTADLSSGKATFSLPATLAPGSYWGAVSYAGDSNFAKDFELVKIVVTKATTSSTLKIAPTTVKVKKTTVGTVTVAINGTTEKANGTVTLKIGSAVVGTGKVVNGTAKVTIKAQTTKGRKVVVASFVSGSASYGSSNAPAVAYTVVK